jgi:predicted DNA-binding transcriptional regulator AlpA
MGQGKQDLEIEGVKMMFMATERQFNDRLIRFPELEKIFGVCKRTVRRRAENGELPPLRHIGRAVGMLESQVKAYFQKLSQPS